MRAVVEGVVASQQTFVVGLGGSTQLHFISGQKRGVMVPRERRHDIKRQKHQKACCVNTLAMRYSTKIRLQVKTLPDSHEHIGQVDGSGGQGDEMLDNCNSAVSI